jgi:aminotransferase EvaB
MTIKVWDYLPEYERDRDAILAAVDKVFRSGRLILGEHVRAFEERFAALCGARFGIGVDNATNAAILTYKALGIGAGDEVVTVPMTAVPTVSAIEAAGAVPVFVDVEPRTVLMDVRKLERALSPRTRAIVPVHLYGQCVDMDPLLELAARHGIPVIEDCAQAHGATYKGRPAGSMGVMATFSFYPTKPLGAFGDGGAIVTSDAGLDKKLRRLRYYGMDKVYYAEEHGYNSRLDEVQAAILLCKLERFAADTARRRELAARYRTKLAGLPIEVLSERPEAEHVFHLFVVRHPRRDEIAKALGERGIATGVHYPWPIHTMRGLRKYGYREGDFPEAEKATTEVLSLPMYSTLTFEDQDRVCDELAQALKTLR